MISVDWEFPQLMYNYTLENVGEEGIAFPFIGFICLLCFGSCFLVCVCVFFFFQVGSTPSVEPSTGLEFTTLSLRTEPRSRVGCLTD